MGFAGWGWLELPRVRDRQDRHTTGLEAGHGYQSHEQLDRIHTKQVGVTNEQGVHILGEFAIWISTAGRTATRGPAR